MVKDVVPMRNRPVDQPDLPKIVNLVSTVILLPQRPDLPKEKQFKLPLEAISMKMGFSQYAPILFAANIMKLTDSIADITALLFSSGKMVLVSGKTENHTRAISQYVRVNIEGVECMMMDDNGKVYKGSLKGRTIFQHCNIHNIVGHGFLGCRIDLQAMCDAAPASCKWFPDLFPGLKCKIWLTASHRCTCRTAVKPVIIQTDEDGAVAKLTGKIGKCTCALKVLIFDSGCVVITGGRHVRDVNSVFFRIKQLAPQFVAASNGQAVIPREDRFYQRLSSMMVPSGMTTKQAAQVQRAELKPEEAIASVLAGVVPVSTATAGEKKKARTVAAAAARDGGTPLMRMAEAGRVEDVTMLLMMDPSQAKERDAEGRSPLERINAIPIQDRTIEHKKIIELLNVYL